MSRVKLSGKFVGTIVIFLALTSVISFCITQRRINRQAEDAFRDKVRQITGMASTTQTRFSDNLGTLVPDQIFRDRGGGSSRPTACRDVSPGLAAPNLGTPAEKIGLAT